LSRIVRKAAEKKAELIGKVDLANKVYTIAADGNLVLGLVNGFRVVDCNMYTNPIAVIIPVMAGIIAKAYRDSWFNGSKVTMYKGDWDSLGKYPSEDYLNALVKELGHLIGKDNVCVQEGVLNPSEIIENPDLKLNGQKLVLNLNQYSKQLEDLMVALERAMEKGQAILRVKLVGTMWGVTEVQKELEVSRLGFPEMDTLFNRLGQSTNLSVKAINRFLYRVSMASLTEDDKKFVGTVLVPEITKAFENIRMLVSELLKLFAPIYKLDNVFRTYTGNPVSWSIPNNLIIEFKDAFTVLLNFLVDVPVIELSIMEPLEVVQANFTKTATAAVNRRV
jgi:hypothetical protein